MNTIEPRVLLLEPDEIIRNEIFQVLTSKNFNVVSSIIPDDVLFVGEGANKDGDPPIGLVLISDNFDRNILSESSLILGAARKLHQQIPVVVMTEIATRKSPMELVVNSWFHTMRKPCDSEILGSVVGAGINQFNHVRGLLHEIETRSSAIGLITSGAFELRNLQEARNLTTMLTLACPKAEAVVIGLSELLQNAIEHGNLEIGYNLKTELLETGQLYDEIQSRLKVPPYSERVVKVDFLRTDEEVRFTIKDEGTGFNWRKYLVIDDERLASSHGRGIALAKMMAFTELTYNDSGNEVTARIVL